MVMIKCFGNSAKKKLEYILNSNYYEIPKEKICHYFQITTYFELVL